MSETVASVEQKLQRNIAVDAYRGPHPGRLLADALLDVPQQGFRSHLDQMRGLFTHVPIRDGTHGDQLPDRCATYRAHALFCLPGPAAPAFCAG